MLEVTGYFEIIAFKGKMTAGSLVRVYFITNPSKKNLSRQLKNWW